MARGTKQPAAGNNLVFERVAFRLFGDFPGCFYLIWTIICVSVAGAIIGFAQDMARPGPYLGLCLSQAMGFLTIPLAFKYCHLKLVEWADGIDNFVLADRKKTKKWFLDELAFFGGSKPMFLCGSALAALAVSAYYLAATYKGDYLSGYSGSATAFGYAVILISAHFAGFGLFAVYCGSRAIWRLGKRCKVRVESHKFGVLSTGRVLLKCYFSIAVAWSFYVLSAVLGRREIAFEGIWEDLPMLILALPTFFIIFGSFIACQMPIHRQMVKFKRDELLKTARSLQKLEPRIPAKLDKDVRDNFEFLLRRRDAIQSLPEWPFGLKLLLGALTSSLTSILPVLVSILPIPDLESLTKLIINLSRMFVTG